MVAPYAVYRMNKLGGLFYVFKTPLSGDKSFDEEWAHRAYRAHMNAFEGIALFAPLYYFYMPFLKTTAWTIGLITTLVLAYELLA